MNIAPRARSVLRGQSDPFVEVVAATAAAAATTALRANARCIVSRVQRYNRLRFETDTRKRFPRSRHQKTRSCSLLSGRHPRRMRLRWRLWLVGRDEISFHRVTVSYAGESTILINRKLRNQSNGIEYPLTIGKRRQ